MVLEALESRQLLSAGDPSSTGLPVGFEQMSWEGNSFAARTGSFLVTFDDYIGKEQAALLANEAATRLGAIPVNTQVYGLGRSVGIQVDRAITSQAAMALVGQIPHLVSFEPDRLYQVARLPNDTRFQEQYALRNVGQFIGVAGTAGADIHVTNVWDQSIGSRNVIVAVIDTGVDLDHPDLAANIWTNPNEIGGNGIDDDGNGYVDDLHGFDFGNFDSDPSDEQFGGHGTQVASCIGAAGNNASGVTGVNWNVSIMALKIADRFGRLSTNAIVAAHDYATWMITHGTNVVASNNSYGSYQNSFYMDAPTGFIAEKDAITRFVAAGASFVTSAGNASYNNDDPTITHFPSSYNIPGVITVAATDNNDALAGFSNFGVQSVDVAAPGENILMAQDGGLYGYNSGTSFSSPIVAGAIALIKSIKPNASAVEMKEALINGSDPLASLQGKIRSGGRINVERTLQIIGATGPVVLAVSPGPVVGQVNPATGQAFNTITITFNKDMDPAFLSPAGVSLIGSGPDDIFGNGNDVTIPVTSVTRSITNPKTVIVGINLAAFAGSRLPLDTYRATLVAANFKDTDGKFLNGTNTSGVNEVYNFRVVATTGDNEPNDTLATATPLVFNASGTAGFSGVSLGNGFAGNLDVDIYRIDIPRGGLITIEVTAKRFQNPSSLDSFLRLFNANGEGLLQPNFPLPDSDLANNDNYFAQDSYIDYFVPTGGTYYVGVSGFGNASYNPKVIASGQTQSLGVYSIGFRVQLSNDDIITLTSTDPNLPRRIPVDDPQTQGITTSTITVTDSRQILDVNVKLDIAHTFVGDLVISLIGPNNAEVTLVNRRGGNGDNFSATVFDDEASLSIVNGSAPFGNSFRPELALGGFDGLSGAGLWTLKINDTTGANFGFLNSWSLQFTFQNNIFGPYESNDTIVTAKDYPFGQGANSIDAFLGDGGFGTFDRDIFRFQAAGGSSLTATVTPKPPAGSPEGTVPLFNSALRLFDSLGNEILVSNSATSIESSIESYVFANAGTYYLAVSEGNNTTYNPAIVGDATGRPALTTGNYSLAITLAAGVSDPSLVLTGNQVTVGITTAANFGTNAGGQSRVGLVFNGIDFLAPNKPAVAGVQVFTGLTASGNSVSNTGAYGNALNQLPFSLTNASDSFNNRLSAEAVYRGIKIERTISYGLNDSFFAIDVYFTNTTQVLVTSLGWMEGFNPDPGIALGEGSFQTNNDIDASAHYATASYTNNQFGNGLTVALAAPAADSRAKVTVLANNAAIRDPAQLISAAAIDPNGLAGDGQLAISYNLGVVAAGGTVKVRYFVMFGTTTAAVNALNNAVNNGTGAGHLTANSATPATEVLQAAGPIAVTVPTLPYRVYYPEGFYGNNIFTFLPIGNANDQANRVVVIARYEQGTRDQLVGELNIAANSRSGLTLVTPDLFANGTALAGRPSTNGVVQSYALEVRSERPVSATFSHYDLNQAGGARVAIGESFTTRVSNTWTFGNVTKGSGNSDFLLFYNTTQSTEKVTVSFYPTNGGPVLVEEFRTRRADGTLADGLEGLRRGGLSINDIGFLPDGEYGVTVSCQVPIVAALSHFDATDRTADGQVGSVGLGNLTGVSPEGQFSLNASTGKIGVLNANAATANVTFTFSFTNGSAYRTLLTLLPNSSKSLNVQNLANFPTGKPYSVSFESNLPVALSDNSPAFNDGVSSAFADRAYSIWGFAEGFRPGDNDNAPGVVEYLRLYNPSTTDLTVEITISYDGIPGSETFRRTLAARRVSEFDMDQFITGDRRTRSSWYTTTVKGARPLVAYMGHFDRSFPGAFGTLGTPLGINIAAT